MQPSAGVPAALPETATSLTRPSDRNVTVARDTASPAPRQPRAARPATPSALCTAPIDGLRGTLSGPPASPEPAATAAAGCRESGAPAPLPGPPLGTSDPVFGPVFGPVVGIAGSRMPVFGAPLACAAAGGVVRRSLPATRGRSEGSIPGSSTRAEGA